MLNSVSKAKAVFFLLIAVGSMSIVQAAETVPVVQTCHLGNPDSAVVVQILDFETNSSANLQNSMLVAVVSSHNNIMNGDEIIGAYPVRVTNPGTGVTLYSGENFDLQVGPQTDSVSLDITGSHPLSLRGYGPYYGCN